MYIISRFLRISHVFLLIAYLLTAVHVNADERTVIIGLGDCRKLITHLAQQDVYYREGFNVRGKEVKSAEHAPVESLDSPSKLKFDIEINVANKYKLGLKNLTAKLTVGTVSLFDNKILLNNYLMPNKDQMELASRCQSVLNHE